MTQSSDTTLDGRSTWSNEARTLLHFIYEFWTRHRRPPNLADVRSALGLRHRDVRRLYRELQRGFAVVAAEHLIGLGLVKAPPFSATPTAVACYQDGEFVSYLGCAAEALTVGCLPWFADRDLEIRSYCACCYAPLRLRVREQQVVEVLEGTLPVVSVLGSPWEWEEGVPADRVCDSFHFVLDAEHAERLEIATARRGVLLTTEQLAAFAESTARRRAWDPDWPPIHMNGAAIVARMAELGVDVTGWQ